MRRTSAILWVTLLMACGDDAGDESPSPDLGSDLGTLDAGSDLGADGGPIDGGQCDVDDDGFESEACGGDDCNDEDRAQSPGNVEVCDIRDNDCDGDVDEAVSQTVYRDADGDGFGDASESMAVCSVPSGFVTNATDCDDGASAVNPGNAEICDAPGVDENCNGVVNEDCSCSSGEVTACVLPGACAAGTRSCAGGTFSSCSIAPTTEACEGSIDEDCDGTIDEMCP